ncbi:MAG: tetratricopeptide repeat protein, partial [Spirochaetes bacterium]|nr:tetratricopeptide repeat protein [Spirochaetota bacterium]
LLKQNLDRKEVASEARKDADEYLAEEEFTKAIALYKISLLLEPENQHAKLQLIVAQEKELIANQNLELLMHLEAAREYHDSKDYFNAIHEWSKSLILDSENQEAKEGLSLDKRLLKEKQLEEKINELISRGIDLFMNKEYGQAQDAFKEVLELDKDNTVSLEYLAKIKNILYILSQEKLRENEAHKHFIMGKEYFSQMKYTEALDEFDYSLSMVPEHEEASQYRERTLEAIRKFDEEEGIRNDKLIQDLLMQGIQFYQIGEFENAIYNFKRVLELDPENEYANEYLGLSEEALHLQKLSTLNEDSPYYPIMKNLELKGKESLEKKDYNVSLEYFNEIKELFPLNREANKYILKIMYIKDPDKVRSVIDNHFKNGIKLYNERKYHQALYEFELVKSIDPDYKKLRKYLDLASKPPSVYREQIKKHFNQGLYYFSKREYNNAVLEWKKAVNLDRSPLTNKYLARCLANIAKAKFRIAAMSGKKSISEVSQMSKEKSNKVNKHYYLGVAYYTSGDYQKALKEWEAVLKLDRNHTLALKNIEKVNKRLKLSSE